METQNKIITGIIAVIVIFYFMGSMVGLFATASDRLAPSGICTETLGADHYNNSVCYSNVIENSTYVVTMPGGMGVSSLFSSSNGFLIILVVIGVLIFAYRKLMSKGK